MRQKEQIAHAVRQPESRLCSPWPPLRETTDGGQHWTSAAYPGGSILSLAAIDGQVLALAATCSAQGGCAESGTLLRRPLAGGAWSQVTQVPAAGITDPTDMIATQAGMAAVLDGSEVAVTSNGGVTITRHPTPCGTTTMMRGVSVAVIAPDGLALLCTGQGSPGHASRPAAASSARPGSRRSCPAAHVTSTQSHRPAGLHLAGNCLAAAQEGQAPLITVLSDRMLRGSERVPCQAGRRDGQQGRLQRRPEPGLGVSMNRPQYLPRC